MRATKTRGGDWIRERRLAADLSQRQVAEQVGVEQPEVSKWETGERVIPAVHVIPLAQFLGDGSDDIIELDGLVRQDRAAGNARWMERVACLYRRLTRPYVTLPTPALA